MTARRRGGQANADDSAELLTESLFPDEPPTQTAETPPAQTSDWTPPSAQPYLAPELAPDPMGLAGALDDPDLPYWLALPDLFQSGRCGG